MKKIIKFLKKTISIPVQIILSPLKTFKKLKLNNFLTGIFLGLSIGLAFNLSNTWIKNEISRQQTLESLELEISNNTLQAKNTIETNKKKLEEDNTDDYSHTSSKYSQTVWMRTNAAEQSILNLEENVQKKLHQYYSTTLPTVNSQNIKIDTLTDRTLNTCILIILERKKLTGKEEDFCQDSFEKILNLEILSAETILKEGEQLLEDFSPKTDRQNHPILKFLMKRINS